MRVSLSVALRIDTSTDPILGSIDDGAGGEQQFTGWLELVARLADMVATERTRRAVRGEPGGARSPHDEKPHLPEMF